MRIELKGTPPSLNKFAGRENSWEYREAKSEWTMKVLAMSFPKRPNKPYERALVKITYYSRRRRGTTRTTTPGSSCWTV